MRIVFAGTPEFAVPSLEALVAGGHDVAAVLTQPDRPSGRGRRLSAGPVKERARALGLDILQPETLADESAVTRLRVLQPEAIVVAAYGLILRRNVLTLPPHGCINVHASLLPRWRGAAPIQRAIEAGDPETGVTIMQMAEGLDTGPILARRSTPIGARDTAGIVHDRLAALGAELLLEMLDRLERGDVEPAPQDDALATYAAKITEADSRVDWCRPAAEIERQVRAMNPWPVVRAEHKGRTIRLWEAGVIAGRPGLPGEVIGAGREGVDVACGANAIRFTVLQRQGGKRLPAPEFLNGYPIVAGERFDS